MEGGWSLGRLKTPKTEHNRSNFGVVARAVKEGGSQTAEINKKNKLSWRWARQPTPTFVVVSSIVVWWWWCEHDVAELRCHFQVRRSRAHQTWKCSKSLLFASISTVVHLDFDTSDTHELHLPSENAYLAHRHTHAIALSLQYYTIAHIALSPDTSCHRFKPSDTSSALIL